jgi:hypothetical protein
MTDGIHGRACDSHVHCIFISVVMLRPSVWESSPKFSVLSVTSIFCSWQQSMDCESHACICVGVGLFIDSCALGPGSFGIRPRAETFTVWARCFDRGGPLQFLISL